MNAGIRDLAEVFAREVEIDEHEAYNILSRIALPNDGEG